MRTENWLSSFTLTLPGIEVFPGRNKGCSRSAQGTVLCVLSEQKISGTALKPYRRFFCVFLFRVFGAAGFADHSYGLRRLRPSSYKFRLFSSSRKFRMPMVMMPISFLRSLILSRTTMIFLKESPMALRGRSSCACFSGVVIANRPLCSLDKEKRV